MKAINKLKARPKMPRLVSDLIDLSLDCLMRCHADPRYEILPDVGHYHKDGICYVDLRGAILAQHLGIPFTQCVGSLYSGVGAKELSALDCLCQEDFKECFDWMGVQMSPSLYQDVENAWHVDCMPCMTHARWIPGLRDFAKELRKMGL
jgi:hypothetical protein